MSPSTDTDDIRQAEISRANTTGMDLLPIPGASAILATVEEYKH